MVILVAVDLHEDAAPVLEAAAVEARARKTDVVLAHAEPIPMTTEAPEFGAMPMDPGLLAEQEDADLQALGRWAAMLHAKDLQVSTRLLHGDPAQAIRAAAEELDAELIVLGTHPREGLRLLLPSVAAGVVRHAPCQVLVVPRPWPGK